MAFPLFFNPSTILADGLRGKAKFPRACFWADFAAIGDEDGGKHLRKAVLFLKKKNQKNFWLFPAAGRAAAIPQTGQVMVEMTIMRRC